MIMTIRHDHRGRLREAGAMNPRTPRVSITVATEASDA